MPRFAFQNAASTIPYDGDTGGVTGQRAEDAKSVVLIADDDRGVRLALTRVTERAGYRALIATSVPEAIALVEEHNPGLAVIDLHMADGSGLDVIRVLRRQPGEAHVMVLSGDPALETRVECFDAGADDFVAKPVYMPELISRLRAAEQLQKDRQALALEKSRAEQLYIYAKEMASFLAHDLNNGFCVALANVEFLRLHKDIDDDCKAALTSTIWALSRMSALTDNFLDIERLEEGALSPRRVMVPLHKLMTEVLSLNHKRSDDHITTAVDCDRDLQVYVDGPLVERVLHNIVGNAMRYVHKGGEIRCAAHNYAAEDGTERIIISIANTGPVIADSTARSLFSKFENPRDAKSRHGLGLYFCRLVCEAHGGTIGVTSTSGLTTFTMEISGV